MSIVLNTKRVFTVDIPSTIKAGLHSQPLSRFKRDRKIEFESQKGCKCRSAVTCIFEIIQDFGLIRRSVDKSFMIHSCKSLSLNVTPCERRKFQKTFASCRIRTRDLLLKLIETE